jgi:hypothetical protein
MVPQPPPAQVIAPPPPASAPAQAESLGGFDPFASDSVRALVDEVAPTQPDAAAIVAPSAAPVGAVADLEMPPAAFPETGAIDAITAPQAMAVAKVIAVLAQLDYFQVLRLGAEATIPEIKKAFYRESRTYHPDRFFHLPDDEVKGDIVQIYKRVTEAYYFLRDDAKRKKYLADIGSTDRKARLRFNEVSEAETKAQVKKEAEEQIGMHPKGRAFYATAMKDMDSKNWGAAQRNLKMALTYESSNPKYKEKLAEVEERLHEAYKASGDKFKIR